MREVLEGMQWLNETSSRERLTPTKFLDDKSLLEFTTTALANACTYAITKDHELRAEKAIEKEFINFQAFSEASKSKCKEKDFMNSVFFDIWVASSPNTFAVVYRQGGINALAKNTRRIVKTAAEGRVRIGVTSRAKVADAAKQFRSLSKEGAAIKMAKIVNLEPATIRRYLVEMFPGDKWKE